MTCVMTGYDMCHDICYDMCYDVCYDMCCDMCYGMCYNMLARILRDPIKLRRKSDKSRPAAAFPQFGKLPDLTINVNSFDDFNKSIRTLLLNYIIKPYY